MIGAARLLRRAAGATPAHPILAFDHPDLVAAYTCDSADISGATMFDKAAANDVTITGATVASGKGGQALKFLSSGDHYVTMTSATRSATVGLVSASFWYLVDTDSGFNQTFMGESHDSDNSRLSWDVRRNAGADAPIVVNQFTSAGGGRTIFLPAGSSDANLLSTWHHVYLLLTDGGAWLYIDGALADSDEVPMTWQKANNAAQLIGKRDSNTQRLAGRIDQVRFFNRGMDAAERAALATEF